MVHTPRAFRHRDCRLMFCGQSLAGGGACSLLGAYALWGKLPLLRQHMRPIYVRLGIINE
jgi:hypothetical protein